MYLPGCIDPRLRHLQQVMMLSTANTQGGYCMLALLLESLCGSCAGHYHPLPDRPLLLCCTVWHFHMCSI